jgi:hypothetical protein
MLEQAKDEFKQYVNEGVITESVESIKAKLKKLIDTIVNSLIRLKDFIVKKIKMFNVKSIAYFNKHKDAIEKGASLVTNFMGYKGLKNYTTIDDTLQNLFVGIESVNKEILSSAENDEDFSKVMTDFRHRVLNGISASDDIVNDNNKFFTTLDYVIKRGGDKNAKTQISYTFSEIESIIKNPDRYLNTSDAIEKICSNMKKFPDSFTSDNGKVISKITSFAKFAGNIASRINKILPQIPLQLNSYMYEAVKAAGSEGGTSSSTGVSKNEEADISEEYLKSIGLF